MPLNGIHTEQRKRTLRGNKYEWGTRAIVEWSAYTCPGYNPWYPIWSSEHYQGIISGYSAKSKSLKTQNITKQTRVQKDDVR